MRPRFARLSLLVKILLSTSVAVTLLFAITMVIVLGNVNGTMSNSLKEEVQGSFQAYTSLWKSRQELLASVSRIVSEMKEVRSAIGTGDKATIEDSAGELWAKISRADAMFLVTEPNGKVLASLGGVTSPSLAQSLTIVRTATAKFPAHIEDPHEVSKLQASGFFYLGGDPCELYQITVTPVYFDSSQGQDLRKVLVAGYKVDTLVAHELKDATNSDFLFETPDGVIASTLNPRATQVARANLAHTKATDLVSDGIHKYAWFRTPLLDISGSKVADLCILRSFEGADQRIAGLSTTIVLLWLAAMCAGLGLTYLLARRIVEPVKQLDRAAAEVARQNYAIEVEVHSEDEMGRLAQTFNAMCASIRQAREELIRQERISTIGRLSGSIVHDLRNPLAAIYGGAEMLVDADLPPAHVKRLAGNIYRASRRIQELLTDLLNVSRGKRGAPEPCRLRELAVSACESLAATAESQHATLTVEIAPEIELSLERSRMERSFVNLIGNAIEAMPEGGEVRVTAQMDAGSVLVHVDDTGPGVAPEIRAKLFQPFVTAGKRNGLGLGLALTRQTVLEHGGDLWVGTAPGGGARFSLRLPGAHIVKLQGTVV
ncbi:MAG TPA: ATP-binding protein [Candidatus Sulfopaludibacter sp.]|nr:ATP-binding protein [Candidatus Sulfopaludibacter sp.]